MIQADLNVILPEIAISVFAMLALLFAVYTSKDKLAGMMVWATSAVFVIVASGAGVAIATVSSAVRAPKVPRAGVVFNVAVFAISVPASKSACVTT